MHLSNNTFACARKAIRPARIIAIFMTLGVALMCAQSESDYTAQLPSAATTTPAALFQDSTITASGDTVNVSRVPVITSTGAVVYWDLVITFQVAASGTLTLASGSPTITKSPILITSGFMAGTYVGPSNVSGGNNTVTVAGPGVTSGGATEWSLAAAPGAAGCTYPNTATWYVGSLASNPIEPRLKAAGITSTAWSYGEGSSPCGGAWWYSNALLGFSQARDTIIIVNFTNADGKDSNVPQDTLILTKKP